MRLQCKVVEKGSKTRLLEVYFEHSLVRLLDGRLFSLKAIEKLEGEGLPQLLSRLEEIERGVAKSLALRLISRQSIHSQSLTKKLIDRYISPSIAEWVIEEFKRLSFLEDSDYLIRFIEKELLSGKSPLQIYAKAERRGMPLGEVKKNLQKLEGDIRLEGLKKLIRKRYSLLLQAQSPSPLRAKALAALSRRGFSYPDIQKALLSP